MVTLIKQLISNGVKYSNYTSKVQKLPKELSKKIKDHSKVRKELLNYELKQERKRELLMEKEKVKSKSEQISVSFQRLWKIYENLRKADMFFSTAHSMGNYFRVYLNHKGNSVEIFSSHRLHTYAGKWRGSERYGSVSVCLNIKEAASIKKIGGLYTVELEDVAPKVKKVKVLLSKGVHNNTEIYWQEMYLTSGYHARTVEEALSWRQAQAVRLLESRGNEAKKRANLKRFVGFQHSIDVGNCEWGTKAFAQRHGLDLEGGYTVEYLLSLEDSFYTRRLLMI